MIDTALKNSFDQRFSLIRTLDPEHLIGEPEQSGLTLMDAGPGSFFTWLESTYHVNEKNLYRQTDENFTSRQDCFATELDCISLETGASGHFELRYEDGLEIFIVLGRIAFGRITNDQGLEIDGDELDQIRENNGYIVYAGEQFALEGRRPAFYQAGDEEDKLILHEFKNQSGTMGITIKERTESGKKEYKIHISKALEPDQVSILTRGRNQDTPEDTKEP